MNDKKKSINGINFKLPKYDLETIFYDKFKDIGPKHNIYFESHILEICTTRILMHFNRDLSPVKVIQICIKGAIGRSSLRVLN